MSIYLSTYLSIYVSIYRSIDLSISVCLSIYLQAWKRSSSARLPHFSKLTTSKRKQFRETSSFFELDNIQNDAILRDFFKFWTWQHQKQSNSARLPSKMECWVQSWHPRTNAFCDFSSPPVESTVPATNKWCQVIRSAAPVTQNHLSKPEDLMLQNATPLRKSATSPPTCHGKCIFADPLQMSHACHRFWKCYKTLTSCLLLRRCAIPCACHAKAHLNVQKCVPVSFLHFWLRNVLRATTAYTFSTSQLPKVVRTWCALYILTSKCALRHNGVHFFDISISKSGPRMVCFVILGSFWKFGIWVVNFGAICFGNCIGICVCSFWSNLVGKGVLSVCSWIL